MLGSPKVVDYVQGKTSYTYVIEFEGNDINVNDPVTIVGDSEIRKADNTDELIGYITDLTITGSHNQATVMFNDNPDYDYEADRILRRAQ